MPKIGFLLFDIDGVIRDVSNSYRLAAKKTVHNFCSWEQTNLEIDSLKNEGIWNNDWDLSLELIKRYIIKNNLKMQVPTREEIVEIFENFYFGGDPNLPSSKWSGFIKNEKILVESSLFEELNKNKVGWGFVSGAERASEKYVLENKLCLNSAPLIAMGDAPEKPDPSGLINLASYLSNKKLGLNTPPIAYIGDTVADIQTVLNARRAIINQKFISIAVAPPHLHSRYLSKERKIYESELKKKGADYILNSVNDLKFMHKLIFN